MLAGAGKRRPSAVDLLVVAAGVTLGVAAGAVVAHRAALGAAVVVVLALVLIGVARPANLAVVALIGSFAVQRLGSANVAPGSGGGISYADAILATAALAAIPALLGRAELSRLRPVMAGVGVYAAGLLPSVITHASRAAALEWAHRLALVAGALLVGAWIARDSLVRAALRSLVVVATILAVAAVADTARNGYRPAAPFELNKNFVGSLLATVLIVAVVAREHVASTWRVRAAVVVVIGAGLLATQSRGGTLGAVFGLIVAFVLDWRNHARTARLGTLAVALILGGFTYVSVHDQLTAHNVKTSSIGVRFGTEAYARRIWRTSPWHGVGIRYFETGAFGPLATAPNNDIDNELAESGLIGVAGFAGMQGLFAFAVIRRRREGALIAAGAGCVAGQLMHGMVDIYWTAGTVSLPFIILGMALAGRPPDEPQPETIASTRDSTWSHS